MMHRLRALVLFAFALLAACSMRSAIDAMSSPEDRAFAQEVVDHLRRADSAWLQARFEPGLWERTNAQIAQVPELFPTVPGETQLVGYSTNSDFANGVTESTREFTLITEGGGRWTTTRLMTRSTGGPTQIVAWYVEPHDQRPPELVFAEGWERVIPWLWGGLIFVLLLVGGIVFLIIRHVGRKSDPGGGR